MHAVQKVPTEEEEKDTSCESDHFVEGCIFGKIVLKQEGTSDHPSW